SEACDGTDLGIATCEGEGFDGGTIACTDTCTLDTSACFECGDGVVNGAEECDGTELGGATCATQGFASGTLACASDCTFDTSMCEDEPGPMCGDGAVNGTEECDGTELGGATCESAGFDGGTITCGGTCELD